MRIIIRFIGVASWQADVIYLCVTLEVVSTLFPLGIEIRLQCLWPLPKHGVSQAGELPVRFTVACEFPLEDVKHRASKEDQHI